jgi:hypothetical protein
MGTLQYISYEKHTKICSKLYYVRYEALTVDKCTKIIPGNPTGVKVSKKHISNVIYFRSICQMIIVIFFDASGPLGQYLKSDHDCFLLTVSQLIIH